MNDSNLTYHLPLLFDELVKNRARAKWNVAKKKKTVIDGSRNTNDKLTGKQMLMRCTRGFRLKVNNQISQISLIDNIKNMVGIKLYCTT